MLNTTAKAALILVVTLVIYIPAMSATFIWDDGQLLTQNALVRGPAGIWKVWVAPEAADSFPLTASVLWLQVRLGRVSALWDIGFLQQHAADGVPNGYHVVNILLHGVVAVLTWRVLLALQVPGAWVAALIFAVHPVCVASVAWISELKNTLSQLFLLLTLLAYLRFETQPRPPMYGCAVFLFCLSLLAKPSVVPLPCVLLLCAWWQRGEITRRDLIRTIPFFAASFMVGVLTVVLQTGGAGAEVVPIGGLASRFANAGMAIWFYLAKVVYPLNLIPVYPAWPVTPPAWYEFLPGAAFVALLGGCWRWRERPWARALLFALGSYTIMLLPVLGFVEMQYMRVALVADHFQYLALASIIALLVVAAMQWLPRRLWIPLAAAVVALLGSLSWRQAGIYRDEETLWSETLKRNPHLWQAHNLLGVALWKKGDPANATAAFEHFQRAVQLKPENPEVHNNLALAYATRGQMDLAIAEYQKAISIKDDAAIRANLGNALAAQQRYAEAEEQYRIALQMAPGSAFAYANLGYALMQQGRVAEAIELFQQALRIDPNLPQARQNLRYIMSRQGGAARSEAR